MNAAAGAGRGRRDAAPAPRHLYIHVPFCAARCDYCEFYSVALGRAAEAGAAADGAAADSAAEAGAESLVATSSGAADARERLFERFVAALRAEWERERERFAVRGLETVYVGGGSPSLLGQERLERLLEPLEPLLTPRAEVTVETNPDDVTPAYAAWAATRRLRVSLGVQSFDASLRAALGRRGEADPAAAFARLREAGVGVLGQRPGSRAQRPGARAQRPGAPGLGVDLMFGLPGQQAADIEAELSMVERLRPDHVSYYELSLAPDAVLGARVAPTGAARLGWDAPELPDDETLAVMYRRIVTGLGELGYEWYEVSNFARPGQRCCHNGAVWNGRDYLGLGPGAVGTVAGVRQRDLPDLEAYLAALERGVAPPREQETLSAVTRARERLLLAARTGAGVPLAALAGAIDEGAVPALAGAGLVALTGGTLRVTRKGRYVANGVCVRLFRDSSFLEA